jgi:hypothetical protein
MGFDAFTKEKIMFTNETTSLSWSGFRKDDRSIDNIILLYFSNDTKLTKKYVQNIDRASLSMLFAT